MSDEPLREIKPVTSEDVPKVLHEALSLAVTGQLRGVVVFMAYHGSTNLRHVQGGHMNLAEVSMVVDHWKWQHFQQEHGSKPCP